MVKFKPSQIFSESEQIAAELKEARENKDLTVKEIAKKINIQEKYLQALEKADWSALPPGVYQRSILKEYAIFLKLDYKRYLKIIGQTGDQKEKQASAETRNNIKKIRDIFSAQKVKSRYFLSFPKIVKSLALIIVAIACFSYLGYYVKNILSAPELIIIEPADNLVINNHSLNVIGLADKETRIMINGEFVLSDQFGNFSKKVNLKTGLNTIVITAVKRYGRETVITRQILVNDSDNN